MRAYYERGEEEARLADGAAGQLEFERTKEIVLRDLPPAPAVRGRHRWRPGPVRPLAGRAGLPGGAPGSDAAARGSGRAGPGRGCPHRHRGGGRPGPGPSRRQRGRRAAARSALPPGAAPGPPGRAGRGTADRPARRPGLRRGHRPLGHAPGRRAAQAAGTSSSPTWSHAGPAGADGADHAGVPRLVRRLRPTGPMQLRSELRSPACTSPAWSAWKARRFCSAICPNGWPIRKTGGWSWTPSVRWNGSPNCSVPEPICWPPPPPPRRVGGQDGT